MVDMSRTQNRLVKFKLLLQLFAYKEEHVLSQFRGVLGLILMVKELCRLLCRLISIIVEVLTTLAKVLRPVRLTHTRVTISIILFSLLLAVGSLEIFEELILVDNFDESIDLSFEGIEDAAE